MQSGGRAIQFNKVEEIAIKVFKNRNHTVAFKAGRPAERNSAGQHGGMVTPKIIGLDKECNASAGLVSDSGTLSPVFRFRKQDPCARIAGRDHQPALFAAKISIFHQQEPKSVEIKRLGLVIVTDNDSQEPERETHLLRRHAVSRHDLLQRHVKYLDLARAAFQRDIKCKPVAGQTLAIQIGSLRQDYFTRTGDRAG
jgi:hypothetical protein